MVLPTGTAAFGMMDRVHPLRDHRETLQIQRDPPLFRAPGQAVISSRSLLPGAEFPRHRQGAGVPGWRVARTDDDGGRVNATTGSA